MIAEQVDVVLDDRASMIDRISNLPDEIIHRILSFLDMKYAIQTSALSKKWKHVWTCMPHLNLNSEMFPTIPDFAKFVKHALSNRNHQTEVSAVKLTFRGLFNQYVVKRILNYAYSHNVRQLTIIRFMGRSDKGLDYANHNVFSQYLCSSHTLKHLTLATNEQWYYGGYISNLAWDFPALETLSLSNMQFGDSRDTSLNLFSKCVNLKDHTLHRVSMLGLDTFNVCTPKLSNLTLTDPESFSKVFNVVAPQLQNLTASFNTSMDLKSSRAFYRKSFNFLQLSTEGLDSLEKVNLSLPWSRYKEERYAPRLLDLFQKLRSAKFLILDTGIIEVLSSCLDLLLHEPCPFYNLKCLKIEKQENRTSTVPAEVINYFLESSPSATLIIDLPQVTQKRTRHGVGKDNMANSKQEKQPKTMTEEYRSRSRQGVYKGTMAKKALSSCPDQLSDEPSSFNNLKCLNQTNPIPRMPIEGINHLFESSPSATSIMDLSQVPKKRSRQEEVDNNAMINKLEKEKQQIETVAKEKRMLEAKIFTQDEIIEGQKVMLEAMKLQHEKRMLEAKLHVQDKIIARQKAMLETMKLQHENEMLEEKRRMQDEVIEDQKVMLETMRLQNEKRMFEAKIQRQDEIVAQQKAMLEAIKLQHEQIETERGNIDS